MRFASQVTIMASAVPDIIRTITPTVLSDRTPALSGSRTLPRPLGWVGPGSRGTGRVWGARGSLQRFCPSRRRHGG